MLLRRAACLVRQTGLPLDRRKKFCGDPSGSFPFARSIAAYCDDLLLTDQKKPTIGWVFARHDRCSASLRERSRLPASYRFILCDCNCICTGLFEAMTPVELVLGSAIALSLIVYLVYAMLRPERF